MAGKLRLTVRLRRQPARTAESGTPVIYVANHFSEVDVVSNWFRNGAAVEGTTGAELDARINRGGPLMVKSQSDAFSNPELDAELRRLGVGKLVLVGVFADQCVYWTVRGALNRGYWVAVAPDALGAASDDNLEDALEDLAEQGVEILPRRTGPER
jgi:nicotinamidase-related amidase